jgi:hypothetical protein
VPATFQNYINDVWAPYLDRYCGADLDDTLIYSDNYEERQQRITMVQEAFGKASLHLQQETYAFHCQEVKCLGLIISMEGIKMDLKTFMQSNIGNPLVILKMSALFWVLPISTTASLVITLESSKV